ncbi:MAG: carbohydrate ABC transporter permease [Lachnospirales bacterium]
MFESKRNKYFPYIVVSPGVLLLVVIIFLPFLQNTFYSFTDYALMNINYKIVWFDNYINIMQKGEFIEALGKTLTWVILNMLLMVFLGVLAAFIQNSKSIKGKGVLQVFLLFPWVLPEVVTGYTWKLLFNYQSGPYYVLAEHLHLIPQNEDIFSNGVTALFAAVLANVWRSFPIIAVTIYAKLQTLSTEQVEAAMLDGASRYDVFRSIEFPHIGQTLLSITSLCFIWTFNSFGILKIMTNGGPAQATEVLSLLLQKKAFEFYDYSYASAFAVMMILSLLGGILLLNILPRYLYGKKNKEV